MGAPSVTYTFTNGTTADATQVNTNFTDVINGITDGTKDLTLSALTVGGVGTFNGNVTLGNSTVDDITITGSIAATIPWKTNATGNIGSSTLAPASIYLGLTTFTMRLVPAATASYTFTFPATAGSAGDILVNSGSATMTFVPGQTAGISNIGVAATVSGSVLTVTIQGASASLSASSPAYVSFRSATAATGTPVLRTITSNCTIAINNTATLGHTSAKAEPIYVYLCDDSGTIRAGVSSIYFDEAELQNSTQEDNSSDLYNILYTDTSGITSKAIRCVGLLRSTQAAAGVWDTTPAQQTAILGESRLHLSTIRYTGSSGYGSTATKVRWLSTEEYKYGNDISVTSETVNGTRFTINKAGIYFISYSETTGGSGTGIAGLSRNASSLTTNVQDLAVTEQLAINNVSASDAIRGNASWAGYLRQGDIIRPHTTGAGLTASSTENYITITRIG